MTWGICPQMSHFTDVYLLSHVPLPQLGLGAGGER